MHTEDYFDPRRTASHVILDQYSLSGPGADRGLGRYANTVRNALREISSLQVTDLRAKSVGKDNGLELFAIQKAISGLGLERAVPYHSTSVYHLPVVKNRPWICSIQDVIPLDLQDYRNHGLKSGVLFRHARRSEVIVANSGYTAARVVERLGVDPTAIEVCPLPVSPVYFVDQFDSSALPAEYQHSLHSDYVVALVDHRTPDPRKRYHWIDQLTPALRECGIKMVITGRGISPSDHPEALVLSDLRDKDLANLYAGALATFYPSAYEGQGLPPLEAMAAGCAVIAFSNSSVEEVVEIPEFLLPDPVPWEQQELGAELPLGTIETVTKKLMDWSKNPSALASLRADARVLADRESMRSLGAGLIRSYERAIS